jgi:hypothetical protein
MAQASASIFIGNNSRALSNNQTNQIVIGTNAQGNGSNTTTIGNLNTTNTFLRGHVSASAFSGSLFGTASNAVSASHMSGSVTNIGDSYTSVAPVMRIVSLTTAEYNAIITKDPNTLYLTT